MAKIGRNEPCPCGSGRKYKRCCLGNTEATNANDGPSRQRDTAVPEAADGPAFDLGTSRHDPGQSLAAWRAPQKDLPRHMRRNFSPLARQMKELAEFEAKRPDIEAAQDRLEVHREEYKRLTRDPRALMKRAEALFAEPPFETMCFTVEDLARAFESVGYPPATGDEEFIPFAGRVVEFLLDDEQRTMLARRLVCLVPDYVRAGRYLDAWIIQHNFLLVCEPPEGGCGPFLLCMFMQGLRKWQEARDQEEREMLGQLGFDPDELRRQDRDGLDDLLLRFRTADGAMATVERFLAAHPQLEAQMRARCRDAENAALELLQCEEGQSLLLTSEEMQSWLPIFAERIAADSEIFESVQKQTELSEELKKTFADVMYTTSAEMAGEVFTESRIRKLQGAIDRLRDHLGREGKDETLALSGAYMAVSASAPANENHFLTMLCLHSAVREMWEVEDLLGA